MASSKVRHKWKWSGNNDGKGKCLVCGLKAKVLTRRKKNGDGDAYVQAYRAAATEEWVERMPLCGSGPAEPVVTNPKPPAAGAAASDISERARALLHRLTKADGPDPGPVREAVALILAALEAERAIALEEAAKAMSTSLYYGPAAAAAIRALAAAPRSKP